MLPQVYKAVLRDSGEEVAVKVQRPGIEPVILRDLFIFRALGQLFNTLSRQVSSMVSGTAVLHQQQ
jgi:predicted unusual protein kinase regulating ubiquinone biosynthesis (AarF/ABC1/UbiB family)